MERLIIIGPKELSSWSIPGRVLIEARSFPFPLGQHVFQ